MRALAHMFVPQDKNDYKAWILQSSGLAAVIVVLISVQAFINFAPRAGVRVLGFAANISTDTVIELTNQKRAEQGLSNLQKNEDLAKAALAKGQDMLEDDYWAHVAPDGTEPWSFFKEVDYTYRYAGENLARDFSNELSAVEAWMASPTHRDNLLSDKYVEIGIAVVEGDLGGKDTTLIVQLFGTRLDTIPTVPVAAAQGIEDTATPEATPSPTSEPVVVAQLSEPPPTGGAGAGTGATAFGVSRLVSFAAIGVLVFALVIDIAVINSKQVSRKSGRRLAHLSFLGLITVIVWIAREGQIL